MVAVSVSASVPPSISIVKRRDPVVLRRDELVEESEHVGDLLRSPPFQLDLPRLMDCSVDSAQWVDLPMDGSVWWRDSVDSKHWVGSSTETD
jgi:hypothetical protein